MGNTTLSPYVCKLTKTLLFLVSGVYNLVLNIVLHCYKKDALILHFALKRIY